VIGQARSTQRYIQNSKEDEPRLRGRILALATQYGRYGYREVGGLLTNEGWVVNHKRVERIWREEGLKVPRKQPKRRRLWLNDGSCIRLRPQHTDHVWSYDFVSDRTSDHRPIKMLTILDEYSRESLKIHVDRRITSYQVIEQLSELFLRRGMPRYIRSDKGPEFIADAVREWIHRLEVEPLFITPGSPCENGYIESFNGTLRNEVLNAEIFDTILEARIIIEQWRRHYNQVRPHSSLGYKPPAAMAIFPRLVANA